MTEASGFAGRLRYPLDFRDATEIDARPFGPSGRLYSGHALVRMRGRGLPISVVDDVVENGVKARGKRSDTTSHYDPVNRIRVLTNTVTGKVITAWRE